MFFISSILVQELNLYFLSESNKVLIKKKESKQKKNEHTFTLFMILTQSVFQKCDYIYLILKILKKIICITKHCWKGLIQHTRYNGCISQDTNF